jgi:hypothetical protein
MSKLCRPEPPTGSDPDQDNVNVGSEIGGNGATTLAGGSASSVFVTVFVMIGSLTSKMIVALLGICVPV